MLNFHALEVNRTTGTVLLDGLPITTMGEIQPHLSEIDGFLSVTVTLPLSSSITVKNPSGSVRVDAPEAGE